MKLAQMVSILRRGVREMKPPDYQPQELRIVEWLRGDREATESLAEWIMSRVEGRGLLPSSTPHDAAIKEGQDLEARQIVRRLRELFAAPILTGSEDEDDG